MGESKVGGDRRRESRIDLSLGCIIKDLGGAPEILTPTA